MPTQGSIPGCAAAVGVAAARSPTAGAGQACWGMAVGEAAGRGKEPTHRRCASAGRERGGTGAGSTRTRAGIGFRARRRGGGGSVAGRRRREWGHQRGGCKENPARLGPSRGEPSDASRARLGPAPCLWPSAHPASARLSPPCSLPPLATSDPHPASAHLTGRIALSRRLWGSGAGKEGISTAAGDWLEKSVDMSQATVRPVYRGQLLGI
jgi:hypothetical protein